MKGHEGEGGKAVEISQIDTEMVSGKPDVEIVGSFKAKSPVSSCSPSAKMDHLGIGARSIDSGGIPEPAERGFETDLKETGLGGTPGPTICDSGSPDFPLLSLCSLHLG